MSGRTVSSVLKLMPFAGLLVAASGCTPQQAMISPEPRVAQSAMLSDEIGETQRWVREQERPVEKPALIEASSNQSAEVVEPASVPAGKNASPADLATRANLETLLRLVAKDNPAVRAAHFRWLAATHKHAQAIALPDPKIEARYFVKRVDDRWMLSLTQDVPYPGKLVISGKIANREAEIARLKYDAALRDALSEVKELYFELYYIDRAQKVTEEIKKLYDRYAALAVGGEGVAAPKLPETFRAESQRAQLSYDLVQLKEIRAATVEQLRSALAAPADTAIGPTDDVADPVEMGEGVEALQQIAQQRNQELAAAGVEVERAKYQAKLARRAPIPDLMLGGVYERMKGDDSQVGVVAGVSLPLWFPKYRAMAKEARQNENAACAELDAQGLKVRADLAKAYFSLSNSFRLVRLYRDTLLPQARQALQSAEELYRVKPGTPTAAQVNLASVLETTATLQNFELARLRATADFYINIARIERTLGTAFKLQPAERAADPPLEKEGAK